MKFTQPVSLKQRRAPWTAGLLLFALLLAGGCSLLAPKTEALKRVHAVYREEFAAAFVPPPPAAGTDARAIAITGAKEGEPLFGRTLQQMRDYRQRHGEDSAEAAHLKVLEGMIYLQAGQYGMASLVAPAVQQSIDKLASGTGRAVRDQLFAKSYPYLIQGWQEIQADQTGRKLGPAEAARLGLPPPNPQRLSGAADAITQVLTKEPPAKLARPEADEGAVYLATTAAIFRLWAEFVQNANGEPRPEVAREAASLIGQFLSPTETNAATRVNLEDAGLPLGRLRYVQWYGYLLRKAGGT